LGVAVFEGRGYRRRKRRRRRRRMGESRRMRDNDERDKYEMWRSRRRMREK
jgi:hypothetical protein